MVLKLKLPRLHKEVITALFFSLITVLTRLIYLEHFFVDWDSVGFALGSISYSLEFTRPHLPGYFLHVKIISALSKVLGNIHTAMLTLSIVYSSLAAFFSYMLLRKIFGQIASIIISLLIITNPMVWFYGSVTDSYSFDWFFSVFVIFILIDSKYFLLIPPIIAIGCGIRQTTGVLMAITFYTYFFVFKVYKNYKIKKILISHVIAVLAFLLWFVPMIDSAGGLSNYLKLYNENSPLPKISLMQNFYQMSSYLIYILVPYVVVGIVLLINIKKLKNKQLKIDKKTLWLLLFWLLPPLFLFSFVAYSKGYFLIIILPLYIIFGFFLKDGLITVKPLILSIFLDILIFLFLPYSKPSIESMLNPMTRKIKNYQVWYERTTSSYLMAISRIKYNDSSIEELSELIKKYINQNESENLPIIFLDPTVNYYARGLQYLFPNLTFITMDQRDVDYYVLYHKLDVMKLNGLKGILNNYVILTRSDFFNQFLKKYFLQALYSSKYVLIIPNSNYNQEIIERYNFLFLR
ncbi:hypothetical protein ABRY23_07535 [Melioribacteraceae bacterium 4301-Me]|uniref:hypothetical protein n=1 Tax=Pyranulibacter aquaticus TaxID=3163344 RepID=UPI003599923E